MRGRKKKGQKVNDYRYKEAHRRNNPPAGIAPTYTRDERKKVPYSYDPHLDPQLQWAGKKEHTSFNIDLVSLHIHERISTRAIFEAVKRHKPQLALFADPEFSLDKQIEFYKHEMGWANRLILGDSLLVMNSLRVKEGMAGKVQMIYIDPPYGIKYSSNFQPRIDRRDVKDKDDDLTREPEQIKAYRDTWKLGIHSYLTYLRDRLLLCRDLLNDSGSIFVQMNDENLHLVRCLMDEVFGRENFVAVITFRKQSSPQESATIPTICDFLLWYAKDRINLKIRRIFISKQIEEEIKGEYKWVDLKNGEVKKVSREEIINPLRLPEGSKIFRTQTIFSARTRDKYRFKAEFYGREYIPPQDAGWATDLEGIKRLLTAERILPLEATNRLYKQYMEDFPVKLLSNTWLDVMAALGKIFVVQTTKKVIERCILMTTDPGDLIFDPTCGSGTTAYCAEKWGRRWITCDTSRVALSIARQRLMTAKFDYYELRDSERGPVGGFSYEVVPHITLESIAKNTEINEIAAKYQPKMDSALSELNRTIRKRLKEWEVPRKFPDSWTPKAKKPFNQFWTLKREKRKKIDASIQRNAPQEALYGRPKIKRRIVRVSGPVTVEAIPIPAIKEPSRAPIPKFEEEEALTRIDDLAGNYLTNMFNLLKKAGGVIFSGGKKLNIGNLRPLNLGVLHTEGETKQNGNGLKVAISFGPQHGPITAMQTDEAIRTAKRSGYDILILAGFSIEAPAQAVAQETKIPGLSVHFVNIAPDVLVGDLLKTSRTSQIFTAFGEPDVKPEKGKDGTYTVELKGVDIYDPNTGEIHSARGEDVAAWFLDTDYDGMTFHISQAFFPGGKNPWEKLQRALKAWIDPEIFDKMRETKSFPFESGKHNRIAVKVIDFRGNEVMKIMTLEFQRYKQKRR